MGRKNLKRQVGVAVLAVAILMMTVETAVAQLPTTLQPTPGVDNTVRAIAQIGDTLWVGGKFTKVVTSSGAVIDTVRGLAAFDADTGAYRDIAPLLPGDAPEARDFDVYGDDLVVGGKFQNAPNQRHLLMIDGHSGAVIRWFDSQANWTVLAAPDLGRIYAGGVSFSAFDVAGQRLWTKAPTTYVSPPGHNYPASHRDLLRDGSVIWSACICDTVAGTSSKAIVKFDLEGNRLPYPVTVDVLDKNATGYAVKSDGAYLYLGAGGSDAIWKLTKGGAKVWRRDTSGSTQQLTIMDGMLVAGGHFLYVSDETGDTCGFRSTRPRHPQFVWGMRAEEWTRRVHLRRRPRHWVHTIVEREIQPGMGTAARAERFRRPPRGGRVHEGQQREAELPRAPEGLIETHVGPMIGEILR